MLRRILSKIVFGSLLLLIGGLSTSFAPVVTPPDYCDLQGAVFIETTAGFADYRVFVQDVEAFANLVVFKEVSEIYADEPGKWFITETKAFSDFSVYIEDVEAFADFSIAYTSFPSAAGCQ